MPSNRLAGHELPNEGRVWNGVIRALTNGAGDIACSCGVLSPYLMTTAARQRWHREHKDTVRTAGDPS